MKSKRLLQMVSMLLTITMLLSVMQIRTCSAIKRDPSQPSIQDSTATALPDPEEEPEYKIIGEQKEKRDATTKYFFDRAWKRHCRRVQGTRPLPDIGRNLGGN